MLPILINALRETLFMVLYASLCSFLCGIPFGIFMATSANSSNRFSRSLHGFFSTLIQAGKATPYIIVMLLFIPLTNWLINHGISFTAATIVPLSMAGSFLMAQSVYEILVKLLDKWQSTTKAMGATSGQIIIHILLPESYRAILEACANTASVIVGFSIIAGAFGAGGLGQLAIEKTITEPNLTIAIISIVSLIVIQQIFKYTAALIPQKQ